MASSQEKFETPPRLSWWARQSRFRKLAMIVLAILLLLGLILGLALGLTIGRSSGNRPMTTNLGPSPPPPSGIWQPRAGVSWQIILKKPLDVSSGRSALGTDVDVWDIDLFDNPQTTIDLLRRSGKKVVCYFSAGSYEDWRPDKDEFTPQDRGRPLDGWPGEQWLDVRSNNVWEIMKRRIDLASRKGCDAIDPDNMDGYENKNGISLTQRDAINYYRRLAGYAASKNMAIGLKNAGDMIPSVINITQFAVNEQCAEFNECDTFKPFIDQGKPVFHIEYPKAGPRARFSGSALNRYCDSSNGKRQFSTVLKNMDLDGWVKYCNGDLKNSKILT